MHPRTLAIICVFLLVGSIAARFFVERFELLPISEEVVLKKAVALAVTYSDGGKLKKHYVTDPAQVREVLATLRIKEREDKCLFMFESRSMPGTWTTVEFVFPNGYRR